MKRIFIPFLLILLIISCSENVTSEKSEEQRIQDSLEQCKKNDPNPNGSSELAVLMREMTAFTDSVRSRLASGRHIGLYPEKFETMLTAKPTDSTLNRPVFNGFANDYLSKLRGLYSTEQGDLVPQFNLLVNSCITCHEQFCQGPIKRIQKMLLATGSR